MTRKGRLLENIVSCFEKIIGNEAIEIKSPDYVIGRNSGSKRELDISLRSKIGSSKILVMVECRDRKNQGEGVDWIEQVATKRDDVGANKAIVVSSSGFTSGAVKSAKSYNIELRVFQEITIDEVKLWFAMRYFEMVKRCHNLIKVSIQLPNEYKDKPIKIDTKKIELEAKVFKTKDNVLLSLTDLIIHNAELIYDGIIPKAERVKSEIALTFNPTLEMQTNIGWAKIESIVYIAELWIEIIRYPLSRIKQYQDESGTPLGNTAEFDFELSGKHLVFALNKGGDLGRQNFTIRAKKEENDH